MSGGKACTDVVIVGAGPYGLSLAAHLAAAGVEHRTIGRAMRTWERHMPDGMCLKSEGFASNIAEPSGQWTLGAFCSQAGLEYADVGRPIPVETFRAYGRWFAQHLVPDVEEDDVTAISWDGARFSLQLLSGSRLAARRVVIASGITNFAHIPAELRGLPQRRISHTSEHSGFSGFEGQRVAVVGAGQSALETAALLRESGAHPQLIARTERLNWNPDPEDSGYYDESRWRLSPTPLGAGWRLWSYWTFMPGFPLLPEGFRVRYVQRTLGPAGAWWLRPRFVERVPAMVGCTVLRAHEDDDGIAIAVAGANGPAQLRVDHLIAGTGYRVSLDRLPFLDPDLRDRVRSSAGRPVLSRSFESSVPGLYFTGLAAANTFGPAMRFVCGTRFAAPRIAGHVRAADARTTRSKPAPPPMRRRR